VAYASKYGATAEIAEKIGMELESSGLDVTVEDAGKVKDLTDAECVILGSAVYYGRWRKGATKFLKKFEIKLAGMPVWFFSSGPIDEGDPVELLDGWQFPSNQQDLADRIQPRDVAVFHGKLDEAKLSRLERKIMETMETPAGDFRDWEMIANWAKMVAEEIQE
jgi:menaquinone-dependent protoporphyrinogen oxidase